MVATNSASAPGLAVNGPPTRATMLIAPVQSDFGASQTTSPRTAQLSGSDLMRAVERQGAVAVCESGFIGASLAN